MNNIVEKKKENTHTHTKETEKKTTNALYPLIRGHLFIFHSTELPDGQELEGQEVLFSPSNSKGPASTKGRSTATVIPLVGGTAGGTDGDDTFLDIEAGKAEGEEDGLLVIDK